MATKREQIRNFLTKNGFASTFQGDQFEQVVNAIELYTGIKENRKKAPVDPNVFEGYKAAAKIFNDLFPEVKIPTSGKHARDPVKEVAEALMWFIPTYEFDMDIVLAATEMYVKEFEVKDWQFMRTSKYFIRKQQKDKTWISDLANYCQQVVDGVGKYEGKLPELKSRVV
jgi:myo-inositol catabolism protein IolC